MARSSRSIDDRRRSEFCRVGGRTLAKSIFWTYRVWILYVVRQSKNGEREAMNKRISFAAILALLLGALAFGIRPGTAFAAGQCVNTGGTGGCFSTIAAAVAAASSGETVTVAAGTYKETGIVITKPIDLAGAGASSTIIDATGKVIGITIEGVTSGETRISGFTIENAGLSGIMADKSTKVTIQDNTLTKNDTSLVFNPADQSATNCPDSQNPFLADDCGEAINLQGTSSSIVANNDVEGNAGGILLDDETAATHDNTISGNTVSNNMLDCGITLASHFGGIANGQPTPGFGVYSNMVVDNTVNGNGAAGVGIFASIPGDKAYNNTVQNNTIMDNGLPGVTLHSHAPNQDIDGNTIVGNTLSGNAKFGDSDAGDTVTTGILILGTVAPVQHLTITGNTITSETVGIWLTGVVNPTIAENKVDAPTKLLELAQSSVPAPGSGPVTLPNGGAISGSVVAAMPDVVAGGGGLSASYVVTFTSDAAGVGSVYFAPGTSCSGLVEVGANDRGAGSTNHSVLVTGNDLPGSIGDNGLIPGSTYSFEVVTSSSSGTHVDNNGGACYQVTIPSS
jgi:parallel beta-helix repeat protein